MDRPCPTCKRPLEEDSDAHRPFCSERCRNVDLSKWMEGDYAIPGAPMDPYAQTDPDNA